MNNQVFLLTWTAVVLGFTHTLLGPDHYLPFTMMARAGKWSFKKTMLVTFVCGLGHVLSSVLLGFLGIGLGIAVKKLVGIESLRGEIASWLLMSFGFIYAIWGLREAFKNGGKHKHLSINTEGKLVTEEHNHNNEEHGHHHDEEKAKKKEMALWTMFVIFVLGPCEPLIPLLIYPAAGSGMTGTITVAVAFSIATIGTMMSVVALTYKGVAKLNTAFLEKYIHAIAGFVIFLSGAGMVFLGL